MSGEAGVRELREPFAFQDVGTHENARFYRKNARTLHSYTQARGRDSEQRGRFLKLTGWSVSMCLREYQFFPNIDEAQGREHETTLAGRSSIILH